jgi:hypothetical protein
VDDVWDPDSIRNELYKKLEKIKSCPLELIMKDISTVKYKPQLLWEWADIAMDVVQKFE